MRANTRRSWDRRGRSRRSSMRRSRTWCGHTAQKVLQASRVSTSATQSIGGSTEARGSFQLIGTIYAAEAGGSCPLPEVATGICGGLAGSQPWR